MVDAQNLAKYIKLIKMNIKKLIEEIESYKIFNSKIDIDFVIILIKNFFNQNK
jgi:hypothetical protein